MRGILVVIFATFCLSASAQGGGGIGDKIYFGGGFGFSAGTNFTNLSVSPLVGLSLIHI